MIWYRHWLELRGSVLALSAAALIVGPIYFRDQLADPRPGIDRTGMFNPLRDLLPTLGADQVLAIARHEEMAWLAILLLSFLLAGDGIKTANARPPGAMQFTLSLPVTRRRVVTSRIVTAFGLAGVVLLLLTMVNGAVLALGDRAVPIVPMLLASGFASLLILLWTCVYVMLNVILGTGWGTGATLPATLLSTPAGMYGMSAAAAGQLDPALLALFLGVLGFVLAAAIAAAAAEEEV